MNLSDPQDPSERLVDEAIDWLVQLQSGQATDDLQRRCANWRAHSPAHEAAFQEAEALWKGLGRLPLNPPLHINPEPPAQPASLRPEVRTARIPARTWAVAATVLLVAGGLWSAGMLDIMRADLADYRTATGEQRRVTLADGSTLFLNTDTALDVTITGKARSVRLLRGEADFVVAPDPTRPFTVTSAGVATRALGTEFAVRLQDGAVTVTVLEHAVRVSGPAGDGMDAVTLLEGERVGYSPDTGLGRIELADLRSAAAWRRGKLIFASQPLAAVVEELNRYRRGRIVVADSRLRDLRVTGVFETADPDGALEAVKRVLRVRTISLTPYLVLLRQ
ncbi:MAG: FecR family protein [Nitrospirota bacterium]